MLLGDLLDEGSDHAAGTAPGGEEVQQDGLIGGLDLSEIIFGNVDERHSQTPFNMIDSDEQCIQTGLSVPILYHIFFFSSIPFENIFLFNNAATIRK
jgi:hypothetical protein